MRSRPLLLFALAATHAIAQQEPFAQLRSALARTDPHATLEHLTDRIGPRLTGSPALTEAERYTLTRFRDLGLQNVHIEPWTMARAWKRGPAAVTLVRPFVLPIPVVAYGWTGSTPTHKGPVEVILLDANEVTERQEELIRTQAASWRNKVLLISGNPNRPMRASAALLPLLRAATASHALAVLRRDTRPGNALVHSEPVSFPLPDNLEATLIPALDLPAEHFALLERLLRAKQPVALQIDVRNTFSTAPVTANNIVAEIPGATHPEQIVILSAHLDSWDLGTGAADDGFGVAAVLAAAEAIQKSGLRPARTLRFILFTGEEQGLLGSRAYVKRHAAELDNIVTAFALDWGAGPITKLPTAGHPELLPVLRQFNALLPDLNLDPPDDTFLFMTDAYAFTLAGLPGIAPQVKSAVYAEQGHSAEDTLDKVALADLRQATEVITLATWFLANSPDLPRVRFTAPETARALATGNQKPMLQVFGFWPFGD